MNKAITNLIPNKKLTEYCLQCTFCKGNLFFLKNNITVALPLPC